MYAFRPDTDGALPAAQGRSPRGPFLAAGTRDQPESQGSNLEEEERGHVH